MLLIVLAFLVADFMIDGFIEIAVNHELIYDLSKSFLNSPIFVISLSSFIRSVNS